MHRPLIYKEVRDKMIFNLRYISNDMAKIFLYYENNLMFRDMIILNINL